MAKHLVISILISLLVPSIVNGIVDGPKEVEDWLENHYQPKEKITKFHFYFHDLQKGNKITTTTVAHANMTAMSPTYFGLLKVMDDPLTVGPELSSRPIGYAQGVYALASFEEVSLFCAISFVFTEGKYNGSTLSVLGHNPILHTFREMPIVGGSGHFRLARGIVTLKNHFFNFTQGNATVEVHGVVLHY